MVTRQGTAILVFLLLIISPVMAREACSDSNEIDISLIPCDGITSAVTCSGNISVTNINTSEQFNLTTSPLGDGRLNFTFNFNEGSYSLVDCNNNTATVLVGVFEQGFGITMFGIMIPASILSFICLFFSGRMFRRFKDDDDEEKEEMEREESNLSFRPRNRLLPIVFMLFAFIPIIFMIGFTYNNLVEYLPNAQTTSFYSWFYILFSWMFYGITLISFVVWVSDMIKMNKVEKGFIFDEL
ncbi:MAG: hypothetical protein ACTSQ4_02415 [Candidatus Heimdallarchaeaceae archaeon]